MQAAAAPELPIKGYKIAVFSATPYVIDFIEKPLNAAFEKVKVRASTHPLPLPSLPPLLLAHRCCCPGCYWVQYIEARLDSSTAALAAGYDAVNVFVNDDLDAQVDRGRLTPRQHLMPTGGATWQFSSLLACVCWRSPATTARAHPCPQTVAVLAEGGVKTISLRCAGFDRADLKAIAEHGLRVVRVPAYSPRSGGWRNCSSSRISSCASQPRCP